jgi:hypothetical protein
MPQNQLDVIYKSLFWHIGKPWSYLIKPSLFWQKNKGQNNMIKNLSYWKNIISFHLMFDPKNILLMELEKICLSWKTLEHMILVTCVNPPIN